MNEEQGWPFHCIDTTYSNSNLKMVCTLYQSTRHRSSLISRLLRSESVRNSQWQKDQEEWIRVESDVWNKCRQYLTIWLLSYRLLLNSLQCHCWFCADFPYWRFLIAHRASGVGLCYLVVRKITFSCVLTRMLSVSWQRHPTKIMHWTLQCWCFLFLTCILQ